MARSALDCITDSRQTSRQARKVPCRSMAGLFLSRPFRCLFDRILRLPLGSETMTVSAGAFSQHSQVFYGFSPTQLEDVVGDCGRTMHRLEDRYCAPA
jgi:hypothetical protein